MNPSLLIVDDDQAMCEMLVRSLSRRGFDCTFRTSGEAALEALQNTAVDVVVTDLNMRGLSGLQLCERIVANRPDVPVIVVTAFGSLDTAIGAIRVGAYDFITKPFDVDLLCITLQRAVQHRRLREEVKLLQQQVGGSRSFDEFIGKSEAMQAVYGLLNQIVDSDASVLITGESGTGKEVVARALHRRGKRKGGPFVAINCAAMPESLLESELFGHARGAFTDARSEHVGLFVQASGGVLFLDEIGEMPAGMQVKLLRVLEERRVRPVGSSREVPFDVRVVAATNRDLESAIAEKTFREDLYFRINVIHVDLPPLRARGGDVLLLAQSFIERFARASDKRITGLSPQAAEKLLAYAWPGNVRELHNCIERAVALTRFESLAVDDLPERVRNYRASHVLVASDDPSELVPMEEVERRYITRVLEATHGNKTLAARILGFDRKTLYNKLTQFKLDAGKGSASSSS
ncbi:MAG TPA: sigma-54 dependent transcriptional regulator [Pseudomonadota bacterium]|nr:sigma-54 dependent transcriptional regulator [Pseudomonadota bacterium]